MERPHMPLEIVLASECYLAVEIHKEKREKSKSWVFSLDKPSAIFEVGCSFLFNASKEGKVKSQKRG
jgi:hypothetical protein